MRGSPSARTRIPVISGLAPGLSTPPLAHRDKKINLNYPLPVSNDPDEPIRQKWITDTYQLLKSVLPPLAVDTPEELAQLSQFVINIIDFRDPDCTMTHWQNPDVLLVPGQPAIPREARRLRDGPHAGPGLFQPGQCHPLDQYGMEYNPVALNEVLAFSYAYQGGGAGQPVLRRVGQHADAVGLRGPAAAGRRYQPTRPEHPRPGRVPVHAGR